MVKAAKKDKKHKKWLFLIDDHEGSTERPVIYQVAEALPTGRKRFRIICHIGRRPHLLLKTSISLLYLVFVHLWRFSDDVCYIRIIKGF